MRQIHRGLLLGYFLLPTATLSCRALLVFSVVRYVPSYSGHVANLVIFCFTLIFNLPRFFELSVEQHSECGLNILRVGPSR